MRYQVTLMLQNICLDNPINAIAIVASCGAIESAAIDHLSFSKAFPNLMAPHPSHEIVSSRKILLLSSC